jgi:hypothetical protein
MAMPLRLQVDVSMVLHCPALHYRYCYHTVDAFQRGVWDGCTGVITAERCITNFNLI